MIDVLIWSAYILWRSPDWGLLPGVPLGPLSIAALLAAWWTWWVGGRLPATKWVVVLLLVKALSGPVLVPRGLHARYFTNASWQGTPEAGLFASWPAGTRIDSTTDFGAGGRDFPTFYLNEKPRFNRPGALQEPFSVEWSGYVVIPASSGDLAFYLAGQGVDAETLVDGFSVASLHAPEEEVIGAVQPRPGIRQLTIRIASPRGVPPRFAAGFVDRTSGQKHPFDRSNVVQSRITPVRLQVDRFLEILTTAIDIVLLALLAFSVLAALRTVLAGVQRAGWPATVIRLLPLVAVVDALWFSRFAWQRFLLLAWGNDQLTYESNARDILFHGPLMMLGAAPGGGEPYYFQPLYAYVVAGVHLLTGEGLWGVYAFQRLGLMLLVLAMWSVASVLFELRIAVAALVLALWFAFVPLGPWAGAVLSENLFIPLVALWAVWLCREASNPGTSHLWLGSLLGAAATLARSTLLLAWAPIAVILFLANQRRPKAIQRVALMFVVMIGFVSLATLRNWIASGQFVPITNAFSINFRLGNEPPRTLPQDDHRWTKWVSEDDQSRAVLEYVYHAPAEFAAGLSRKAAYPLGLEGAFDVARSPAFVTTAPVRWTLAWVWVAASIGFLMGFRHVERTHRLAYLIPLTLALSHFAVITLIFPYAERLVLPFYSLLLPYAAIPFGRLAGATGSVVDRE